MRIYKFSHWNFNVHYRSPYISVCVNFYRIHYTAKSVTRVYISALHVELKSKLSCSNSPLLCRNLHMIKTMDKFQYFGFIERLVENNPYTRLPTFHSQYAQKRTLHAFNWHSCYSLQTTSIFKQRNTALRGTKRENTKWSILNARNCSLNRVLPSLKCTWGAVAIVVVNHFVRVI